MKTFMLACLFFAALGIKDSKAQSASGTPGSYYVVLGAYSLKTNAAKFSKWVKKQKLQPQIEFVQAKNLYYVYIQQTSDHDAAIESVVKFRNSGPFRDAWVYTAVAPVAAVIEPVIIPVVEEKPREEIIEVKEVKPPQMSHQDSVRMIEAKIKSEVDKRVMSLEKGKVETLDYIFFYRDASVMRPESKYEVDRLVNILKENLRETIRIHGHTNGNAPGKIIKRADSSTDFFSLDNTVEDYGSAKELSELRATAIRDYLIAKGINKKRMTIKAWGGKKPLYKFDDAKAEANVRVEIEVIKN